nr:E4 [human papillomavirus 45]
MADPEVPVTTRYPLLRLLDSYNTPPRRPPKPHPWAPQNPTSRRRLLSDLDSVDSQSSTTDLSTPTCTTRSCVQVQVTTNDGKCVVVTLRL